MRNLDRDNPLSLQEHGFHNATFSYYSKEDCESWAEYLDVDQVTIVVVNYPSTAREYRITITQNKEVDTLYLVRQLGDTDDARFMEVAFDKVTEWKETVRPDRLDRNWKPVVFNNVIDNHIIFHSEEAIRDLLGLPRSLLKIKEDNNGK